MSESMEHQNELSMIPKPPDKMPQSGVLGRFQPFHNGHVHLIEKAWEIHQESYAKIPFRIAIGSSNRNPSLLNPWNWEERKSMIKLWIEDAIPAASKMIDYCAIPDIENPPNWVQHAEKYHGKAGIIASSDVELGKLYLDAGWPVIEIEMKLREQWEGWRVRETARMISTINNEDAQRSILSLSIPEIIVEWILQKDRLHRLSTLGDIIEHVG